MTIQLIPARNCTLSDRNVRHTASDSSALAELAADIAARGVLQNLIGFAIPKKRGKFEITAGGRRLAAVHSLIAAGTLAEDYEIPVFVMNDTGAAAETSLAENFQRLPMNPADECTAFRYFIDVEGKTAEDVAKRFGLTTRLVEGRIRLAGLAEEVFEALRNGEITLEVAQAFATTSDVTSQSAVYSQTKGSHYGFNAASIRRAMTNETVTGAHALAKLVGRDAYVAAGGRVETDLFAAEAEEIWLDAELVQSLGEAKMAEAAGAITGYANVVPVFGHRPAYNMTCSLRPVQGEKLEPTEEQAARLAAIEAEIEAIEGEFDEAEDEETQEQLNERLEVLEAEAQSIENRTAPIDDELRAKATAFIVIGPDGSPTLHETVYVEPTVTTAAGARGTIPISGSDEEDVGSVPPALGKPLRDELAVQRTKLLGLHLANDPGMAVDLGIFLLADAQVSRSFNSERGSSLQGTPPTRGPFGFKPEGVVIDQLQSFCDALDHSWTEHRDICARFDAFRALDDDRRAAWAGWTIAQTLEPKLVDEPGAAFHNHLGRSLGIDVAGWWRPTAANFFNRVRKGVVLDALGVIGGHELRSRYATAKKGDIANAAEKICAGTAIIEAEVRAKATSWVPDVMTFGSAPTEVDVAAGDDEAEGTAAAEGESETVEDSEISDGDRIDQAA